MNEWCIKQHGASGAQRPPPQARPPCPPAHAAAAAPGLTQRVRESTTPLGEAEAAVLAFVRRHTQPGCAQLAGNAVHCDLAFLKRYMPALADHLHYRIVDVSSVNELARRWLRKARRGCGCAARRGKRGLQPCGGAAEGRGAGQELRKMPHKECKHTARADILESIAELRW